MAKDVRYYVKKAFPGDKTYLAEFGFPKLHKVRFSTPTFIMWMFVLYEVAETHKAALNGVGMTDANIAQIETHAEDLLKADRDQETFKRTRTRLARARTTALNHMWSFVTQTASAAEIIFRGDEANLSMFKLPTVKKQKKDE